MNFIVYTKPGCPQCKVLKMKMDAAGVSYKLVEEEEALMALGVKAAPALMADSTLYAGPEAIKWFTKWAKEHVNGN